MNIDADFSHSGHLPLFNPPFRLGWPYVAYLVGWIVSRTQELEYKELVREALPFLFDLSTILERRNELTRRILRILVDPTWPASLVQEQTAAYWLKVLADDQSRSGAHGGNASADSDQDDELANLCRQFGEVAIQS